MKEKTQSSKIASQGHAPFAHAKWIWIHESQDVNEYVEFYVPYEYTSGTTVCRISCDGDYTLWVNGQYVASNQYGDFEHYKIYDELVLSPYLTQGKNELKILVWHFGKSSQRYLPARAGLLFEIEGPDGVTVQSDETILCRKVLAYQQGEIQTVSSQLGFSFFYDATQEAEGALSHAVAVEKHCQMFPRPTAKLTVGDRADSHIRKAAETYFLIDLGQESVGLPVLELISNIEQRITVFWGEDLQDDHVRGIIGNRNFSYGYKTKKGHNTYTNYMLRTGCRYLEVYAEEPIELLYAGILPQYYAVERTSLCLKDPLEQRIYDTCVRTLELCMMEHYVDTPWREQCLYVFDARNQMLCGYSAFQNGNRDYARANLRLIGEDRRADGLLSICYPCGVDLTIPSFSLYYFTAVKEYTEHTKDKTLAAGSYSKLISVMETFLKARTDGLVPRFSGSEHWNFYDWTQHMDGHCGEAGSHIPDLMINCLLILALEDLKKICAQLDKAFPYDGIIAEEKQRTRETFYSPEKKLFAMTAFGAEYTALGNAVAILAGLTTEDESRTISEALVADELLPCTLAMRGFVYDALLKTDQSKYRSFILQEIRCEYKNMLDAGATSVWETTEGAAAFHNAGSLCHGWSAVPIHYYHLLSERDNEVSLR